MVMVLLYIPDTLVMLVICNVCFVKIDMLGFKIDPVM